VATTPVEISKSNANGGERVLMAGSYNEPTEIACKRGTESFVFQSQRATVIAIAFCFAHPVTVNGMGAAPVVVPEGREFLPVLYANKGFLWPNASRGRIDIPVCWENPNSAPGATPVDRAAWRDQRRRSVEEWSRHTRINFLGWDGPEPVNHPTACKSGAPGLHVVICSLPKDSRCPQLPGSQAEPGGYSRDNGLNNGIRLNPQHNLGTTVHEFGHALGFYHEEERLDAPPVKSGNCRKQNYPNNRPVKYGAYDKTGIMSYCEAASRAPWLSPNDIASVERIYGRRKSFSLVTPRAKCVAVHRAIPDARPIIRECDETDSQEWQTVVGAHKGDAWQFRMAHSGPGTLACLAASGAAADAKVQLRTCDDDAGWRFHDMQIRGFGGLCLDLDAGRMKAGTRIHTWVCGTLNKINQRWTRTAAGQIRYGATNMCAQIGPDGRLQLWPCNADDDAQKFSFAGGAMRRTSTGKCLEVAGPSDAEYNSGLGLPAKGSPIQEAACNASLTQKWNITGALRYDANPQLCLTRRADSNGPTLYLAGCSDSPETQVWDYYF
jgi:Ricin-type beta-trefoil lectin domain/Astacin (Peptidase family M12A)